jgi:hypothetical protein
MNGTDLLSMTTFKVTKHSARLTFSDTRELIVAWPLSIAPASHAIACDEALTITRRQYGQVVS